MKSLKLLFLVAAVSICTVHSIQAQYEEGQIDVNAGIGLVPTFGTGDVSIPVSLSVDYGLKEDVGSGSIGVGGYIGYAGSTQTLPFFGDLTYTYIIVGARGTYHMDLVDGFDTYGGILAGFNIASVSIENEGAFGTTPTAGGGFTYSFFAGGRYYFTENIGAFAEVGYGISILNVGLCAKF